MVEGFVDVCWLLKSGMVKEFCVWVLTKLVTVDDALSTPALIRHNQKILNLCLQLLRALPNFVFGLKLSLTALNWRGSEIKDMYEI